jgi:accessory gene regulator protein AgrB
MSAYNYKQASQQLNNHLNLNKSELLALKYGFEMVISDSAQLSFTRVANFLCVVSSLNEVS